jgi:hypothetical protein
VNGLAEAGGEHIPLGYLIKPGGKFMADAFKQAGSEAVQEVFTQIIQTGYEKGVINPKMTWGEAWAQVVQAGIAGGIMGGGMAVGSAPFKPAADAPDEKGRALIDMLSGVPGASRSAEQAPPTARVRPIDPQDIRPGDVESPIPTELLAEGRRRVREASAGVGPPSLPPASAPAAPTAALPSSPPQPAAPAPLAGVQEPQPGAPVLERPSADGQERTFQPTVGGAPVRPPIRVAPMEDDEAITPAGTKLGVRYGVVSADDLVTSHSPEGDTNPDYPQELQPRDRSRSASLAQVADLAGKLTPRLLDKSAEAGNGAPIISEGGVVESGNGRVMAITKAYRDGLPSAKDYAEHLAAQGYPVHGIKNPVLVRIRTQPMTNQEVMEFTRESNMRTTLAMSSTERAFSDAAAIQPQVLECSATPRPGPSRWVARSWPTRSGSMWSRRARRRRAPTCSGRKHHRRPRSSGWRKRSRSAAMAEPNNSQPSRNQLRAMAATFRREGLREPDPALRRQRLVEAQRLQEQAENAQ